MSRGGCLRKNADPVLALPGQAGYIANLHIVASIHKEIGKGIVRRGIGRAGELAAIGEVTEFAERGEREE